MKKLFLTVVLALSTLVAANAQVGIIGGWTSSKIRSFDGWDASMKSASLFHLGVAYRAELGPLLVLQPALSYQVKGANVADAGNSLYSRGDFVELGLGVQLGLDLILLRPFLMLEPFIGYDVSTTDYVNGSLSSVMSNAKNRFEYGIGLGGGLELMRHLQLSVQWFMNAGRLYNNGKLPSAETFLAQCGNLKNYQGVKVTLGLFF